MWICYIKKNTIFSRVVHPNRKSTVPFGHVRVSGLTPWRKISLYRNKFRSRKFSSTPPAVLLSLVSFPKATMHFHWVSEEKSTRSKTTLLLSYRDTLYIYPETGCVDVVPRGNVSGISCPVVVGNSPPSVDSLSLSLSLSPSLSILLLSLSLSARWLNNYSILDGPSHRLTLLFLPPLLQPYRQTPTSLYFCLLGIDIIRSRGLSIDCTENQLQRSSLRSQTILSLSILPSMPPVCFSRLCLPYHCEGARRGRIGIHYASRLFARGAYMPVSVETGWYLFVILLLKQEQNNTLYFIASTDKHLLKCSMRHSTCLHDDNVDSKSRDWKLIAVYHTLNIYQNKANKAKLILTKHGEKEYSFPSASMQFNGSNTRKTRGRNRMTCRIAETRVHLILLHMHTTYFEYANPRRRQFSSPDRCFTKHPKWCLIIHRIEWSFTHGFEKQRKNLHAK